MGRLWDRWASIEIACWCAWRSRKKSGSSIPSPWFPCLVCSPLKLKHCQFAWTATSVVRLSAFSRLLSSHHSRWIDIIPPTSKTSTFRCSFTQNIASPLHPSTIFTQTLKGRISTLVSPFHFMFLHLFTSYYVMLWNTGTFIRYHFQALFIGLSLSLNLASIVPSYIYYVLLTILSLYL